VTNIIAFAAFLLTSYGILRVLGMLREYHDPPCTRRTDERRPEPGDEP